MERRTIIVLIILGLVIGGYFLVRFVLPNEVVNPADTTSGGQQAPSGEFSANPYQPAGSEEKANFPQGSKLLVSGRGGSVETNNFFNNAEGYYPEMESLLITRNQKFQLVFYRNSGEFVLTILQDATEEMLPEIYAEIMNILGVGKTDLCKLNISYLREYDGGDLDNMGALPLCSSVLK